MHAAPPARLLLFGECLVDRFASADIPGGAPYNVARHLSALGLAPIFISRIGRDAQGALLRADMARFGLRADAVREDLHHATGTVLVHEEHGHHRFEILRDQAYDYITPPDPKVLAGTERGGATWIYFGTLAQRQAGSRAALAALRAGVEHRAFLDFNWREGHVDGATAMQSLATADAVKLGGEELDLLLARRGLRSDWTQAPPAAGTRCAGIAALLKDTRVADLIVTYGGQGYALWGSTGDCRLRGASATLDRMVDTVGAGDAFASIALAGLASGWNWETTLARANAFAAAICGVRGAAPAGLDFYRPFREEWSLA